MLREKLLGHYSVKIYRAEMFKLIKQGAPLFLRLFAFICFISIPTKVLCIEKLGRRKHFSSSDKSTVTKDSILLL